MYVCKNMVDYEFHKHTDTYLPYGDVLTQQTSNGTKGTGTTSEATGSNY